MERMLEIATHVSTPLGLGGLFAVILFFTLKQLITRGAFPTVTRGASASLIKQIIDRLFVLALVAMILGFIAFILPQMVQTSNKAESITFTTKRPKIIGIYPSDLFGPAQQIGLRKGIEHYCSEGDVGLVDLNAESYAELKNGQFSSLLEKLKLTLQEENVLAISGPSITEATPAVLKTNLKYGKKAIFITSAAPEGFLSWDSYRKEMPVYRISTGIDRRGREIAGLLSAAVKGGSRTYFYVEKSSNSIPSFGKLFLKEIANAYTDFWADVQRGSIVINEFDGGAFETVSDPQLLTSIRAADIIFYLGVGADFRYLIRHVFSRDHHQHFDHKPLLVGWMNAHSIDADLRSGAYYTSNIIEITDFDISAYSVAPESYHFFASHFSAVSPAKRDEAFSFDAAMTICESYVKLKSIFPPPANQYINFDRFAVKRLQEIIEKDTYEGVTGVIGFNGSGSNPKGKLILTSYDEASGWRQISLETLFAKLL